MTVEVAAMNRMAVALAADSAVTVSAGRFLKTHDSAIKIFMLSKFHPIGVMVYNNASLLGVPWETIIKLFRRELADRSFETLEEYGQHLIAYLDNNQSLFPLEVQESYYLQVLESEYENIQTEATKELVKRIQEGTINVGESPTEHFLESASDAIRRRLAFWEEQEEVVGFDNLVGTSIVGKLSGKISEIALRVFGTWPIDAPLIEKLREIAVLLVTKNQFAHEGYSGVVIAGFGDSQHYPVLQHYLVGGIYGNRLKHELVGIESISEDSPSSVEAYAYTEMVDNFLHGITSSVLSDLEESVVLIREMPRVLIDEIDELSQDRKEELKQLVHSAGENVADEFSKHVLTKIEFRRQKIMSVIETLPPPDLAQVASTLVSLSSFQQRMSFEHETVGGPVDVAVISKGDGFVWIDRKHYFREDLNHHFFNNYFRTFPNTKRRQNEKESNEEATDSGVNGR